MNPITRRDFLTTSGSLVVSVSIPGAVATAMSQGATIGGKPPLLPSELDSWIAVLPDGSVTAFFGKTEMGQGVDVAIGQIVAEELDVAYEKVKVVMGDTAVTCNQGGASGSTGIQYGGKALRNAAAEARRVLVEMGAKKLGVAVSDVTVENGVVMVPGYSLQKVSYGELIGGRHFHHKLEWNKQYGNPLDVKGAAQPKPPSQHKVVGKSFPQKVITEKVMGREQYITDVHIDGMLHARVIRPPNAGCNPVSVDESSIKGIPGARVVREKDGAVIGMTPFRESWPIGDGVQKLRLELDGYRSETVVVPLDRGVDLSFALRKAAQPEPPRHKDAKHAPARPPGAKIPSAPAPTPKPAPRLEPVPL